MNNKFKTLLAQAQTGSGADWVSERELLQFNSYLAKNGYGVSRMEVMRAPHGKVPPNFGYGILPRPIGPDSEHWMNHFDPQRSAAFVRETVKFAQDDGADFLYKVWAEQPP